MSNQIHLLSSQNIILNNANTKLSKIIKRNISISEDFWDKPPHSTGQNQHKVDEITLYEIKFEIETIKHEVESLSEPILEKIDNKTHALGEDIVYLHKVITESNKQPSFSWLSLIAAVGVAYLILQTQGKAGGLCAGNRSNVMLPPHPSGGLSSEPAKAGQPKASEIMRRLKEKSMSEGK